jgi:sugar lactone lactonase YvrE
MFYRFGHFLLFASLLFSPQPARAVERPQAVGPALAAFGPVLPDRAADRVLGQATFTSNTGAANAAAMDHPAGVAIAPPGAPNAGRLFVVEFVYWDGINQIGNSRVLSWPSAASFASGQAADLVIGQGSFTAREVGTGLNRFNGPEAAAVDLAGRLWVADTINHRVLRFDPPFSSGMDASLVLGQPKNQVLGPNQGGQPAANTLYFPRGLAADTAGNLYVADDFNHRVLRFSPPFTDNMPANLVIGQADFSQNLPNRGGGPAQNTLNHPKGLAVDAAGNLYAAEYDNNRVTRFSPPLSSGMNASGLYGQPGYASNSAGLSQTSLDHPVDVAVPAAGDALYVTDQQNVRVLAYSNPLNDLAGTAAADGVYGQPDYFTETANGGGVSRRSLNIEPLGLAVDANGSLYHADYQNNRLLAYDVEWVGNGAPGSCTEAGFDAALAGGGTVAFNCGTGQINLSNTKTIAADTTIDGRGVITLSGQDARRLFIVQAGALLKLHNIVLTAGYSEGDGGAIFNEGNLELANSTIRDSLAVASGGAIVSYGPLTIKDSLLEGNRAHNGGALYPRWGGAITIIDHSVLRNNHTTGLNDGWGGAILAWDGAPVTIYASVIENNSAHTGGGIYNFANSTLMIWDDTRLIDNEAAFAGGGIYNAGGAFLFAATLEGNSSRFDGGGLYNATGQTRLTFVTLNGNSTDGNGGGLYNGGAAELIASTLSGNTAINLGGGMYSSGSTTLTNVTLSGNSASNGGGLANGAGGTATLSHVTLSGNSATSFGGGLYNLSNSLAVKLNNSIVASSPNGGNCGGAAPDNAYSLSSDFTCQLGSTGSRNNVDPLLTPLGNYGGLTQVHRLKPGSPAIDFVSLGCPAPEFDQRGFDRPVDGDGDGAALCDAGAVEVAESDLVNKVFLSIILQ